jgi:uncharacterized membrane protein
MWDVIGVVFAFLLVLGTFAWVFVVPLVALLRTRQIRGLADRLNEVERELVRLRRAAKAIPTAEAAPPERVPSEVLNALPVAEAEPAPRPRPAAPPRKWAAPALDSATLEAWIGRQGMGWAAVVLLLFATAFFLKYAFDNAWVGELGRVAIGVFAGAALCVAGYAYHRRGWRAFSQMLTAGGVVLLYLAAYGSFGYYHLLPRDRGAIFLVTIVAEAFALAVLYEAPAIAIMAVVGGLLNPVLLHADRDQYRSLFMYLLVLDAAVVALALFRRWWAVATLALVGTQGLFWLWYQEHYHPEKLSAALAFQAAAFVLFLAYNVIDSAVRGRRADVEGLVRLVLAGFFVATAGYVLLHEDYRPWLGTLALGLAIVYAGLAWVLLRRKPDDPAHVLVAVAVGLGLLATVFPLEARAAWIALGWAAEGLALWWFGLRIRSDALKAMGVVLLGLGVVRLVVVDTPWTGREPFVPVFNEYGLPALAVAGCVLGAAAAARRVLGRPRDLRFAEWWVAGLGGVLLVWFVLSVETYQYFTAREARSWVDAEQLERWGRTSLSVLWAAYAAVVLAVGFALDSRPLRWVALGLFGLTLAKVVLVDTANLGGLYRVTTFLVLAVLMGAATWGYQKLEAAHRATKREALEHEPV